MNSIKNLTAPPRGYLAEPFAPPIAHRLRGEPRHLGNASWATKSCEDFIYNGHEGLIIRKTDNAQPLSYPNFNMPPAIPSWQDVPMTDSAFDVELVKAKMAEGKVNQTMLAKAIGLTSQSAVSNILKGTRNVKAQEARAIYEFLGIPTTPTPNINAVPIIGIASAGTWREAVQMPIGVAAVPSAAAGKRSFALEVSGDSMNLLIEHGGYVVVDPDRKELIPGKCYLIQNGHHEATVKMYQRNPSRFEPCSDNPEHKSFLMSDADFAIIGRIVWKGAPV